MTTTEDHQAADNRRISDGSGLSFSIVIPVKNEAAHLKDLLARLKTQTAPQDEIIVVDGGSGDNTVDISEAFADKTLTGGPAGRAAQMDAGARKAEKDILVFLHADTLLPVEWRFRLTQTWNQIPPPGLAAFQVAFDSPKASLKFIAKMANWRTRSMTKVPHGDQAISVRRDAYLQAGGFPRVPLLEEYYLARLMKKNGPLEIIPDPVITSARRYEKNGIVWNNLRNLAILFLFYVGVSPARLAKIYK